MSDVDLDPALSALGVLKRRLEDLRDALESSRANAIVYSLPRASNDPEEGDLSDVLVDPSASIPVDRVEGADARRRALAMYNRIERRRDQPPTRLDRLPGIVTTHFRPVASLALAVNDAKDQLRTAIASLPRYSSRSAELFQGTELHHVLLLQAYRHIRVVTGSVDAVGFGWSRRSRVIDQMEREDVLKLIRDSNAGEDGSRWYQSVVESRAPLLARVRTVPPHPVVNVQVDGEWSNTAKASMPVLIVGSAPSTIRHLGDYMPETIVRQQRPMMLEDTPLIAKLRLYQYRPEAVALALERRESRRRKQAGAAC